MLGVMRTKELLLHIVDRGAWDRAASGSYFAPDSLRTEGFVHCSTRGQLLATAERLFADAADPLVVLWVDPDLTGVRLRWEPAEGGELFPHLFGPLPRRAIVDVTPLERDADGRFRAPGRR